MKRYSGQSRMLLAVDCLIFGFDQHNLKLLLVQRAIEPQRGRWSLIGGFSQQDESFDKAAQRILEKMTGLQDIYMEPLQAFSDPGRDPVERAVSMAYVSLIDINAYKHQITPVTEAQWFMINEIPELIFDHQEMIEKAKAQIRYRACQRPILFELLPEHFTLPQLQAVYENIYERVFDDRNFYRKIRKSGLIVKQKEKNKMDSKKGAYYYKINKEKYNEVFNSFLSIVPFSNMFGIGN